MAAQPPEDFLTPEFLQQTGQELESSGFVTDEHEFAPYREMISKHAQEIEAALNKEGWRLHVQSGFLSNHPAAGYSFYIYNPAKFGGSEAARHAVSEWLDRKYAS